MHWGTPTPSRHFHRDCARVVVVVAVSFFSTQPELISLLVGIGELSGREEKSSGRFFFEFLSSSLYRRSLARHILVGVFGSRDLRCVHKASNIQMALLLVFGVQRGNGALMTFSCFSKTCTCRARVMQTFNDSIDRANLPPSPFLSSLHSRTVPN